MKLFSEKYSVYFFTALYLIISVSAYPYYKYYMDPDGLSMLTIAKKYADGNFHDAVNGFWYPMISWIIALLLKLHLTALQAAKIANISVGFFTIIGLHSLIKKFDLPLWMLNLFLFTAVLLTVYFVYDELAVDLLMMMILLY